MGSIRARRRPTDFDSAASGVLLYSGTCTCCCCCLHWLGALAGAGVGYARSVESFRDQRLKVRRAAQLAVGLGLVIAVGLTVLVLTGTGTDHLLSLWGIPLLFAPFLFFLPAVVLLLLVMLFLRRSEPPLVSGFTEREQRPGTGDMQGAYRDAAASEQWTVDRPALRERNLMEFTILKEAAGRILLFSFLGTLIGYVIMVVLLLIMMASR